MASTEVEFKPWPKIPRANGEVCITEKINGTNGCIVIESVPPEDIAKVGDDVRLAAVQSRKRFITPEDDNFGFAAWVKENEQELLKLGPGYHYGEWAGPGIQKNPHNLNERRFFLFDVKRWGDHNPNTPDICDVVPVLYEGECGPETIDEVMIDLRDHSVGAGYIAEGIVLYNCATKTMTKYTFENPDGKWCQ